MKDLKAKDGKRIKGQGCAPRIAYAVAQQTQLPRNRLTVLVNYLYKIRNDVVHNSIENPDRFDSMTTFLELVAEQTFRFRFSMTPTPCAELANYLSTI